MQKYAFVAIGAIPVLNPQRVLAVCKEYNMRRRFNRPHASIRDTFPVSSKAEDTGPGILSWAKPQVFRACVDQEKLGFNARQPTGHGQWREGSVGSLRGPWQPRLLRCDRDIASSTKLRGELRKTTDGVLVFTHVMRCASSLQHCRFRCLLFTIDSFPKKTHWKSFVN